MTDERESDLQALGVRLVSSGHADRATLHTDEIGEYLLAEREHFVDLDERIVVVRNQPMLTFRQPYVVEHDDGSSERVFEHEIERMLR